jgi:hypothetical protein
VLDSLTGSNSVEEARKQAFKEQEDQEKTIDEAFESTESDAKIHKDHK